MRHLGIILTAPAAIALGSSAPAAAQCDVIDFEQYAVGTKITSQYPGVTFQAWPQSCQGNPVVYPIIVSPLGGCSSGTRALGLQTGCPDFSPEALWIHFSQFQGFVTFTLGEQVAPDILFDVRAWDGDGNVIDSKSYRTGYGVHHLVQMGEPDWGAVIEWVEIRSPYDWFESIDDLSYGLDDTAPTALIDTPVPSDCICEETQWVWGLACDEDGSFDVATLEYRHVSSDTWTVVGRKYEEVCTRGPILPWDTRALPHGHYYLRLTVENECGLVASDTVYTYVDRRFGDAEITEPPHQGTVCGVVEIEGTMHDSCYQCFDYYTVHFAQSPNGPWFPVDPRHSRYTDVVIGGTIAVWDTTNGVPDGRYYLKAIGYDECDNVETVDLQVEVNNRGGLCGCVSDLDLSGVVDFADILRILSDWGPCPE